MSLRVALRERPRCIAPVTSLRVAGDASDIGVSLWPSRSERVSQGFHVVAPVRSLPCTARPMITFITSFELQMHPNVSKNSMWPLSRNEFEQTGGAQRPPVVALRGRSRLQERPGGVAARRRSGSLFASDLAVSLRSRRSQLERPYGVALAKSLSCLRAMETRATSGCRSENTGVF
ncbi:hypothetical protein DY000_02012169 [Brassica cretica]|uniref:Uncharacterized protein n=1 Tax=Brassica cretica TaxID=69181 RepID=A0ABQ7CRP5_BRACR|nr:hypothetical protein DY000_02012169 [Brassica cretica]